MKRARIVVAALALALASCSSCPRPVVGLGNPRIQDQARGLPRAIDETSVALLDETKVRHCQVLFEPAFSSAYAVWFVQDEAMADVTVVLKVGANDQTQSYAAPIDRNTAERLSKLCLASLTTRVGDCGRLGYDGVWYHAAHPGPAHGYAMASFWSPKPGTLAHDFVKVAEALRDYAALPEALRHPAWLALQEAMDRLTDRLDSGSRHGSDSAWQAAPNAVKSDHGVYGARG